ncbi:MAG: response regulator transcription factor [Planctomycetes bacterium]|nr:response regulator transcription factor [Planctomycetota bacterium]
MRQLLVVEDESAIRQSLVDWFAGQGVQVQAAASLAAAEAALAAGRFHCVLLDLRLPDGDGLALLRRMRRAGDRTPVIAITARGEEGQRVKGLESGADDYVVKPFSVRELSARIATILRRAGEPTLPVRLGTATVDLAGHEVRRGGRVAHLLPKEAELLAFLLRNPGRTVSRDELLKAVWGHDSLPTTRTVDTHVFQLRQKLEERPEEPRILCTVHGVGYRLDPGPDA